jgi:RHS repeat-associated protein
VEADGATTTMVYDDRNRVIERTDPLSRTTATEYDGIGNVTRTTDPMGFSTTFVYNRNGWMTTMTDAMGGVTRYEYDPEGETTAMTDARGNTTHYEYDKAAQLRQVTDPLDQVTRFEYDKMGNQTAVINALDKTTNYEYNELDLLIKETDPLGNETTYQYDALRRMTARTDANGITTRYGYNPLGWLTSVTDAEGNVTTYEYDAVGNRTAIIDANGVTTTFEYNFLDQLKREINPLGDTWAYSYDARGNMVRRVDGKWQATYYEYDKANQLIATVYGEGANTPSVTFEYDANGNEIAMHDWNGDWTYTYDKLNRRTSATDYLSRTLQWEYDAIGNRTAMIYPDGERVEMDYDAADQLKSLTDFEDRVHTWDYDPLGYIEAQVNPNSTRADYAYDAAGRLTSLTNTGAGGSVIAGYAYTLDKVGNRVQTVEQRGPETVVRSYSYDDVYRLTRARTNTGQDMRYVYDPVGNRLQKIGTPEPVTPSEAEGSQPVDMGYTYNDLNSMLTAGPTAFAYDANGNRVRKTEPLTTSDYLSAALSLGADITGTVVTDYVYDYENRLTEVSRDLHYTVTLETGSMIMRVPYISPTMEAEYIYDGYGRRVEKHVTTYMTGTTVFTTPTVFAREYGFDGLDPVYEYDYAGDTVTPTLTSAYVYGNGRMVFMERTEDGASETYWYHYDGLGSVVALTDEAGADVCQWTYDEYGNPLQDCPELNHYTYTGQEVDPETGLVHFFARYYDAGTGVWMTQDEYRGLLTIPNTMHRYKYVNNNSITHTDFYGYATKGERKRIKPFIEEAANTYDIPPETIAVLLELENKPGAWNNLKRQTKQFGAFCLNPLGIPQFANQVANKIGYKTEHWKYGAPQGLGNMSPGAAEDIKKYYAAQYADTTMAELVSWDNNSERNFKLTNDYYNVYFVAANIRRAMDALGYSDRHNLTNDELGLAIQYHNLPAASAQGTCKGYCDDTENLLEDIDSGEGTSQFYNEDEVAPGPGTGATVGAGVGAVVGGVVGAVVGGGPVGAIVGASVGALVGGGIGSLFD